MFKLHYNDEIKKDKPIKSSTTPAQKATNSSKGNANSSGLLFDSINVF